MGYYEPLDAIMDKDKVKYDLLRGEGHGHSINYRYLRKIIDLCEANGIKLYLVYYPMYHPEYYYDQDYYYNAYNEFFSDVELLDYSAYPLDDDCRYDAHHLNTKGSQIFTEELVGRFGFK